MSSWGSSRRTRCAGGIKLSDVAGTWNTKSYVAPDDSVVTSMTTVSADGKTWTLILAGRAPIPMRVVASGGASIVTEAGPYPSILKPGLSVTLLRDVGHYAGDKMTGTFEAHYSSGEIHTGRVAATRQ
jgi:hypothetical protein